MEDDKQFERQKRWYALRDAARHCPVLVNNVKITGNVRLLLWALIDHCDGHSDETFVGEQALREELVCSHNPMDEAVSRLKQSGLVTTRTTYHAETDRRSITWKVERDLLLRLSGRPLSKEAIKDALAEILRPDSPEPFVEITTSLSRVVQTQGELYRAADDRRIRITQGEERRGDVTLRVELEATAEPTQAEALSADAAPAPSPEPSPASATGPDAKQRFHDDLSGFTELKTVIGDIGINRLASDEYMLTEMTEEERLLALSRLTSEQIARAGSDDVKVKWAYVKTCLIDNASKPRVFFKPNCCTSEEHNSRVDEFHRFRADPVAVQTMSELVVIRNELLAAYHQEVDGPDDFRRAAWRRPADGPDPLFEIFRIPRTWVPIKSLS